MYYFLILFRTSVWDLSAYHETGQELAHINLNSHPTFSNNQFFQYMDAKYCLQLKQVWLLTNTPKILLSFREIINNTSDIQNLSNPSRETILPKTPFHTPTYASKVNEPPDWSLSCTKISKHENRIQPEKEDLQYQSSLVHSIPKHNVLVIGSDMNAQIGKNKNHKYSLHNSSNRNGQHLTNFTIENRLTCFNTNFKKRQGKLWTYTYASNTEAQIDYVFVNKKLKNSAINYEAYCYILTFDPAQKYYSKVIHRKEMTHSNGQ